jgi:hypothetical protein
MMNERTKRNVLGDEMCIESIIKQIGAQYSMDEVTSWILPVELIDPSKQNLLSLTEQ